MKIISVEVAPSTNDGQADPLLILRTDSALAGLGEVAMNGASERLGPVSTAMSALLVGRDPFDLRALTADAEAGSSPTSFETAILTAAGTAMADLCGQQLGIPIHQLLGGRVRDRVRACAIGWMQGVSGISGLLAAARRTVDMGFTALRVEPMSADADVGPTWLNDAISMLRHLREALPDQIDLVVDAGGATDADTAVAFADLLGPIEPLWLEVPAATLANLHAAGSRVSVPVAAGRGTGSADLNDLVMDGLVDHVVLEIGPTGGLLEGRRIAALAEVYHIGVIPSGTTPVSLATALHLAAATPNLTMVEMRPGLAIVEDGSIDVDLRPGLGVDVGRATTMEVA